MCLGVPMQVKTIENDLAICEIDGVQREASLMMIDHVRIGDYVLIHAGFAIEKVGQGNQSKLVLQKFDGIVDPVHANRKQPKRFLRTPTQRRSPRPRPLMPSSGDSYSDPVQVPSRHSSSVPARPR